jgi:hypothetical protein
MSYLLPPELLPEVVVPTERGRLQLNKVTQTPPRRTKNELEVAQRTVDYGSSSRLCYATTPELEGEIPVEDTGPGGTLCERVTSDDIARVAACATGFLEQILLLKGGRPIAGARLRA